MGCGRFYRTVVAVHALGRTRRVAVSVAALGALATFGAPCVVLAQQATAVVTGRVTDAASGAPLANATVRVVGTQLGSQTGEDGSYTLRGIPAGSVNLQFARIGYEARNATVVAAAGATVTQNVTLASAAFSLSAVVTTVTGQQRKVELANTTAQINLSDKVAELPVANMGNVLSGRAAGVQVVSGGATGSGSRVRIRGQSSLSLTSEPVVVIDGVRMTSSANNLAVGTGGNGPSRLDDINPDEIENIEILKGPSAATLYGTEAANGVIVITTKKGTSGQTRYTFYGEQGLVNNTRDFPNLYSLWGKSAGQTTSRICTLANVISGCAVDSLSTGNILNTDSLSVLGQGNRKQYGAQITGGSERVQFFVSGETEGELGI